MKEKQNTYGLQKYIEEFKNVPDPLPDSKIEPEPVDEFNNKIELFKVIERNKDCQDNHINILTKAQFKNDAIVDGGNHSHSESI